MNPSLPKTHSKTLLGSGGTGVFLLTFFLHASPFCLFAVQTEKFLNDTFSDFAEGKAHGIAITTDGFLKIGPTATQWNSLPASVIWAVVRNSEDILFVAAGNEGQVFKVEPNGKTTEFFKAKELQVQALALDESGNLFAASMPKGKVYQIDPQGKSSIFFDPKEKYIWALQFDEKGNLFVATGEKGRLYKVSPSGKGTLFYDSNETHLRTLLIDSQQRLWVGSEGNGLVYRFDHISGTSSTPFVAYDSSFREIKALLASSDGSLFVAAMGDQKSSPSSFSSISQLKLPANKPPAVIAPPIELEGDVSQTVLIEEDDEGIEMMDGVFPFLKPPEKLENSEIVRILPNGSTEKWWSGKEDVYCLAMLEPDRILAGTNKKGKLFEITGPKQFSIFNQLEAETITALIRQNKNHWLAATSNPGILWILSMTPSRKGSFESKVFDTRASSRWGVLDVRASPESALLNAETRTGNTSKPDKVWGPWISLDEQHRIQSPIARFIQYKITLEDNNPSPSVDSVTLYYQTSNQPPKIARIILLQPNIALIKMPKIDLLPFPLLSPNPMLGKNVASHISKSMATDGKEESPISMNQPPTFQQIKKLGWRSLLWQANDPNGDELRYNLFYRTSGSIHWKLLKQDLDDPFFSWDAATWPDGEYYIKIIATDRPSNPEGEALMDEMISDVFIVDNTAPTIDVNVSPKVLKKGSLMITIHDTTSIIDKAEFSLDGEEWQPLLPVGRLYDTKSNEFLIPINKLKTGNHYVVIRASDSANNVATQTAQFQK